MKYARVAWKDCRARFPFRKWTLLVFQRNTEHKIEPDPFVCYVVFLTARTRISDSREVAKTRSWKNRKRVIREMGRRREKEPSVSLAPVCFSQQFARSLHITRELKQRRRRRRRQRQRQRERQKCNRFRWAKEQLCTSITLLCIHFFAVFEQLRRESA